LKPLDSRGLGLPLNKELELPHSKQPPSNAAPRHLSPRNGEMLSWILVKLRPTMAGFQVCVMEFA
jgi:hypothetical protein